MRFFTLLFLVTLSLGAYTQMNIYHDKAQIIQKRTLDFNVLTDLPKSMIDGSFVLYAPKVRHFDYFKEERAPSLYDFWSRYLGKEVLYKDKKVILRVLSHSDAVIELPSKQLKTVSLKELLFPAQEKQMQKRGSSIVLPKEVVGSKARYSYLLRGISWKSGYVLTLRKNKKARFQGRFEITNNTQKSFGLDRLKLVAGRQHTKHYPTHYYKSKMRVMAAAAPAADIASKALFSYYSYTLKKKVRLLAKSKRSIPFLDRHVNVVKHYRVTLANPKYLSASAKHTPQLVVEFTAPLELPNGDILFFDAKGNYMGDGAIGGVPKGEKVSLTIGEEFFSTIEERVLFFKRHKKSFTSRVEYTLHNASQQKRSYELIVPLQEASSCSITSSQPYRFKDANTIVFNVTLQPEQTKKFTVLYEGN